MPSQLTDEDVDDIMRVNVSSMLGRIPFALTTNFREEVQHTHPGIQFSLISPGVDGTDKRRRRVGRVCRAKAVGPLAPARR